MGSVLYYKHNNTLRNLIMQNIFFTSDQHFGHNNILKFTDDNNQRIRPLWDNIDDMNNDLVERYNSVVKPGDKVYFLGDVCMTKNHIHNIGRLNGDKVLIKGNHDKLKLNEYSLYFRDIRACHIMNNIIFTHIPIHEDGRMRYCANVHGHTHQNSLPNKWYINVSVEQTNFTPVSFDEITSRIVKYYNLSSLDQINGLLRQSYNNYKKII